MHLLRCCQLRRRKRVSGVTRRVQRLQLLLSDARRRESEASKRLRQARQSEHQAHAQQQQLEVYRNDYDRVRYGQPGETVQSRRLLESHRFVSNLQQVLEDQRRHLAALSTRCQEYCKEIDVARRRRESLEALVERYQAALERESQRQEQRASDELVARRRRAEI